MVNGNLRLLLSTDKYLNNRSIRCIYGHWTPMVATPQITLWSSKERCTHCMCTSGQYKKKVWYQFNSHLVNSQQVETHPAKSHPGEISPLSNPTVNCHQVISRMVTRTLGQLQLVISNPRSISIRIFKLIYNKKDGWKIQEILSRITYKIHKFWWGVGIDRDRLIRNWHSDNAFYEAIVITKH